jgi:homocysteine S-methyltransferase
MTYLTDGAMATYLFTKGAAHPVELLNLANPALITEVHREYLAAGAQIIRANTFGGPLSAKAAGVRIARDAVHNRAQVAGVIGSVGGDGTRAWFQDCARALDGVDLLILETFTSLAELRRAVDGVRDVTNIQLVAQVSVEQDGRLRDGSSPDHYGPDLHSLAADAIGFNCSFGPKSILPAFEIVRPLTNKPMSVSPNAGFEPLLTPAYMATFARRFLDAGATYIGTCCGSTPEHIRQIRTVADEHATLVQQWPRT